jgi:hypothetical protein
MNKMVIGGVNNRVFVASNLGRIEHFYSVLLGLPREKDRPSSRSASAGHHSDFKRSRASRSGDTH